MFLGWAVIAVALGTFAPSVERALSGAGWQADGSQSMLVRDIAQRDFGGQASSAIEVVVAADRPVTDPSVKAVILRAEHLLAADPRISRVVPPEPGVSISRNGRAAVILGGQGPTPTTWSGPLTPSSSPSAS